MWLPWLSKCGVSRQVTLCMDSALHVGIGCEKLPSREQLVRTKALLQQYSTPRQRLCAKELGTQCGYLGYQSVVFQDKSPYVWTQLSTWVLGVRSSRVGSSLSVPRPCSNNTALQG